jgi:hypothetical protein
MLCPVQTILYPINLAKETKIFINLIEGKECTKCRWNISYPKNRKIKILIRVTGVIYFIGLTETPSSFNFLLNVTTYSLVLGQVMTFILSSENIFFILEACEESIGRLNLCSS